MNHLFQITKITIIWTLLTLLTVSCGKRNKAEDTGYSDESSSLEEVSKSIGSTLDANETSLTSNKLSSTVVDAKGASTLNALQSNSCNDSVLSAECAIDSNDGLAYKYASLTNCTKETPRLGLALTMNGSAMLKYSNVTCSINSVGDSVTRTYDFLYTTSNNANVHIRSSAETFADPITGEVVTIGGGGQLTHENSGWSLNILGRNVTFTRANGIKAMDYSIRTSAPIMGHGYRYDGTRVVESGSIEIFHKLAKTKAIHTIHNLTYSTLCCHPISGSIDIVHTGTNDSWNGTITFNSCGSAQLTKSNSQETQTITLNACE